MFSVVEIAAEPRQGAVEAAASPVAGVVQAAASVAILLVVQHRLWSIACIMYKMEYMMYIYIYIHTHHTYIPDHMRPGQTKLYTIIHYITILHYTTYIITYIAMYTCLYVFMYVRMHGWMDAGR